MQPDLIPSLNLYMFRHFILSFMAENVGIRHRNNLIVPNHLSFTTETHFL